MAAALYLSAAQQGPPAARSPEHSDRVDPLTHRFRTESLRMATAALSFGSAHFEISRQNTTHHARDLRSRVRQALQHGNRHFVIDCGAWNQLDLSMLSSLIQCATACREHGASFEVANMSSELRADVLALSLGDRLGLTE